jgi:hypothetical protein
LADYHADVYLIERLKVIIDELDERLEEELSEKDLTAVRTALVNAITAGFHEGVACVTTNSHVVDADGNVVGGGLVMGVQEHLHVSNADHDEWAELYGDD